MPNQANVDNRSVWFDFLSERLPYRYQRGYAGAWFKFTKAIMADTLEQLTLDALLCQLPTHPNCPPDILGRLATEVGLVVFPRASEQSLRERIEGYWDIVTHYGTLPALESELEYGGYGSVSVVSNLVGTTTPIPGAKSPEWGILPYPSSREWWAQFSVVISLTEPLGSGVQSNLLTDEDLEVIRDAIWHIKPVDWICREIVLIDGSALTGPRYDTGEEYDDPALFYADGSTLPSTGMERHPGQLNMVHSL